MKKLIRWLTKSECPKSVWGHWWKNTWNLNAGFWHQGALGREGKICENCAQVVFPETDREYFERLPEWLKREFRSGEGVYMPRGFKP